MEVRKAVYNKMVKKYGECELIKIKTNIREGYKFINYIFKDNNGKERTYCEMNCDKRYWFIS